MGDCGGRRMNETELKKCPFCGGDALIQEQRVNGDDRFRQFWIICSDCFSQTRSYLCSKMAIEAWNRRVSE